ncbi:MAG TPA: hypothetical protein VFH92_00420 [Phenylobacterium sp.]|nr:hypothetical protein [Phenylobacterium sp.]
MRLTLHKLVILVRWAGVVMALAAAFGLTGPIHYEDLGLPVSDKVAHGALFYALTLLMLGALPRSRMGDMALVLVAIGGASEVVQGVVGRDMDVFDFLADSVGVAAAVAPAYLAAFRRLAREHPHATLADLRALDRRRPRAAAPVAEEAA